MVGVAFPVYDVEENKLGVQYLEDDFITFLVGSEAVDEPLGQEVFSGEKVSGYSMMRVIFAFRSSTNLSAFWGDS